MHGAPGRTTDLTTLASLIAGDQMRYGKFGLFAGIAHAKLDELDSDYTNFASKGTFTKMPPIWRGCRWNYRCQHVCKCPSGDGSIYVASL